MSILNVNPNTLYLLTTMTDTARVSLVTPPSMDPAPSTASAPGSSHCQTFSVGTSSELFLLNEYSFRQPIPKARPYKLPIILQEILQEIQMCLLNGFKVLK